MSSALKSIPARYLGDEPHLSVDEERNLLIAVKSEGSKVARNRLVLANMKFITQRAHRLLRMFHLSNVPIVDLLQEGVIGLYKGIDHFDLSRTTRLLTYAHWWIDNEIRRYLVRHISILRVVTTQNQIKVFGRIGEVSKEIFKRTGVFPSTEEIAKVIGVSPKVVETVLVRLQPTISLDTPIDVDGVAPQEYIPDEVDMEADVVRNRLRAQVRELVNRFRFSEQEHFIIEHRLTVDNPMTLTKIGEHFGYSRERARQIEQRLKGRLQTLLGFLRPQYDEQYEEQ